MIIIFAGVARVEIFFWVGWSVVGFVFCLVRGGVMSGEGNQDG